jgi:hypothetical protein
MKARSASKMKTFVSLLAGALMTATAAQADPIVYIGEWDAATGGGVHTINPGGWNGSLNTILSYPFAPNGDYNNFTGNLSTVSSVGSDGVTYYEVSIDNVHSSIPNTGRIYASWTNITTPLNKLSFPNTLFQVSENQPGWTIVEQIFICAGNNLYCDNYPSIGTPPGTGLIGMYFGDGSGMVYQDLVNAANMPTGPYTLTEVFHLVAPGDPAGDIAGAIVVGPFDPPSPFRPRSLAPACPGWSPQCLACSAGGDGGRKSPEHPAQHSQFMSTRPKLLSLRFV